MICYRQLTSYLPTYLTGSAHWQVEAWPPFEQASPSGIAWCTIHPTSKSLDIILVREGHDPELVANQLIEACRRRWPKIEIPGSSDDSVDPPGRSMILVHAVHSPPRPRLASRSCRLQPGPCKTD